MLSICIFITTPLLLFHVKYTEILNLVQEFKKNNHKTVNYIIKHIKYEIIYRNKIKVYRLYLDILMYYTTTRILHFLYLVENIEKVWEIYHFFIHLYRVKGFRKLRSISNTLIIRFLNTVILYLTCI